MTGYDISNNIHIIEESDITYLKNILLDNEGNLKVVPYSEIKDVPQEHISQLCGEKGFYCIPTTELIDFLKGQIEGYNAIEIGSGNGTICKELGIIGTDNFMQLIPKYKKQYELFQQTIVPYGKHVENIDALKAVKKYNPDVVIGAWCTHKYDPMRHKLGGNEIGIEEHKIIKKVKKYIHIGNELTHDNKPILDIHHKVFKAEWLVSRSVNKKNNVIWIWEI